MQLKRYRWLGLGILLALLALTLLLAGCRAAKEKKPIVFAELNWGSAQFQVAVARYIVEKGYGYPTSAEFGGTIPLFQGLRRGDVHVTLEIWLPNQQEAWDKAMAAGEIVDMGTNFDDNWQGFVVPTYVIKGDPARGIKPMAPDLKSVMDLKKYKDVFKNSENPSKGALVSCVAGWECEKVNEMKLKAYGLYDDYDIILPGSADALFASLKGAYDKGKPWLGYMWGPEWPEAVMDLTVLEEPPYSKECWAKDKGCAYPAADVRKAIHPSLEENAPDVVEMIRKWRTTSPLLSEALAYMQREEASPQQAAIKFLKEREDVWTQWVPFDVAQKVKEALKKEG
jgi:glycine betaine/proline transport system substrate-binding protein